MGDKYNAFKDYLNNTLEVYPDEIELEDLVALAIKQDSYENNKGYGFERTEHNPREKAFYEQWLKENEPLAHINHGHGLLQDLFIEIDKDYPFLKKWITEITNRDRMIAATVIQWLGSNCGMSFLDEALRKVNYRIVQDEFKTK